MIMMKKILLTTISVFFALGAFAQAPNGSGSYYKNADGLSGEGLKTALSKIICGSLDAVGYNSLDEKYKITDKRADGTLRDWYDNTTKYNWTSDGWNKEHLVPQSWFKEASPMKSDIVHVVPTDSELNNTRGSDPLAEVGNKANDCPNGSYCLWGSCKTPGYSGKVFEPNDEIKGDVARIYFYMATCYEDVILNWKGKTTASTAYNVLDFSGGSKYQPFKQWYIDMLLRWAKNDPVDEVEIARNKGVYEVQNNRNPFVDYPGLEQYIWGSKKNDSFSYSNYVEPTEYVIEYGSSGSGTGGEEGGGDNPGGGGTVIPSEGSNTYQLITTQDELEVGKGYLIVCTEKEVALSAQGNSIRDYADVTISDNTITTDVNEMGKPYEITIGGSAGAYTLYDAKSGVYFSLTSNDNKLHSSASVNSDKEKWTISISGDAQITNKSYSERSICYNSGSPRFACYKASSNQMAVQLYKSVTATAIKHVDSKASDNTVYDLSGRKLDKRKLNKGLYVKKGKKIIIN